MNKSEVNCVQDPLTMAEEIDRLARLCEAKDAEIKHIIADGLRLMEGQQILQQQFYEAQAQIAMQAEALRFENEMRRVHNFKPLETTVDALSATSKTVAAWRAKETEPLRREVAQNSALTKEK